MVCTGNSLYISCHQGCLLPRDECGSMSLEKAAGQEADLRLAKRPRGPPFCQPLNFTSADVRLPQLSEVNMSQVV
jgi:hypothetical protein